MNKLEYEMIDLLKNLKEEHNVIEIKAEYENEGSRQEELMRLKDVTSKVDLPIILKVGGVEAVTDVYSAITLGVGGIVAPMAETSFAVSKFLNLIQTFVAEDNREDIEFAVNLETITAHNNIEEIFSLEQIDLLSSITVGRVDFTASMEKDRSFANTEKMLQYCRNIFKKARLKDLKCALGGAVSPASETFIRSLVSENLLDKYETRKIVYASQGVDSYKEGLLKGIAFELLWLKSKRRYYHRIRNEDEKRIEMLEKRLQQTK